jgi:hypothetical protein
MAIEISLETFDKNTKILQKIERFLLICVSNIMLSQKQVLAIIICEHIEVKSGEIFLRTQLYMNVTLGSFEGKIGQNDGGSSLEKSGKSGKFVNNLFSSKIEIFLEIRSFFKTEFFQNYKKKIQNYKKNFKITRFFKITKTFKIIKKFKIF